MTRFDGDYCRVSEDRGPVNPQLSEMIERRTKGHLPIDEWGPTCAGCGTDEFRIDGYCSIECRDEHSDEDIEELGDALVKAEIRAEEAGRERDEALFARDQWKEAAESQAKESVWWNRASIAEARAAKLEAALDAIRRNAEAWHGDGRARALDVIATWAADPDTIPAALLVSAGRDEQEGTE